MLSVSHQRSELCCEIAENSRVKASIWTAFLDIGTQETAQYTIREQNDEDIQGKRLSFLGVKYLPFPPGKNVHLK